MNAGYYWLILAIVADVLSTFLSAKADGLTDKPLQMVALVLYVVSFGCSAVALKYMQAGILYVLWSGLGVVATAMLARFYLGQSIDVAGWVGIGLIVLGMMIIGQFSNIDR